MFEPRRRLLSIDLNRAGMGLMEIVSKADIRYDLRSQLNSDYSAHCRRSPEQASEYVRTLQAMLRSVGASDGNMEQVRESFDGLPTTHFLNIIRDLCVAMLMSLSTVQDNCLARGAKLRILTVSAS